MDVGRADGTQDAFLVRVHTDEGLVGIGEADTSPYLARTMVEMPASHAISRGARELLVGEDSGDPARLWRLLYDGSSYYGRSALALHVVSAIDIALWDLAGKAAGKPVCELLGGRPVGHPRLRERGHAREPGGCVAVAQARGRGRLRGAEARLGPARPRRRSRRGAHPRRARDDRPGARPHDRRGPGVHGRAALALLDRVSDVGLYWLEEPLAPDDYDGYRRLCDAARGADRRRARPTPRSSRSGASSSSAGWTSSSRTSRAAAASRWRGTILRAGARIGNVEVVPHCFSTGVLVAASLHMAAGAAKPTYSEFSVADSPLAGGLLTRPFELHDGKLAVPEGPGLGIELDDEAVEQLRVR